MVVANDDAFARVFTAHHVTRNRLRHNSRIRKREIFGDNAAPAVGSKFDRSHGSSEKYTRSGRTAKRPDWPAKGGLSFAVPRAISRSCRRPAHGRAGK